MNKTGKDARTRYFSGKHPAYRLKRTVGELERAIDRRGLSAEGTHPLVATLLDLYAAWAGLAYPLPITIHRWARGGAA